MTGVQTCALPIFHDTGSLVYDCLETRNSGSHPSVHCHRQDQRSRLLNHSTTFSTNFLISNSTTFMLPAPPIREDHLSLSRLLHSPARKTPTPAKRYLIDWKGRTNRDSTNMGCSINRIHESYFLTCEHVARLWSRLARSTRIATLREAQRSQTSLAIISAVLNEYVHLEEFQSTHRANRRWQPVFTRFYLRMRKGVM